VTASHWLWIAIAATALAGLAAIGVKTLLEFSRSELDAYCRRRDRRELFGEILDHYEDAALGAECWQIIGAAIMLISGAMWLTAYRPPDQTPDGRELITISAIGAFLLLVFTVWVPWAVARSVAAPFLYYSWPLWKLARWPVWPLTVGVSVAVVLLRRLAGQPEEEESEEEAFEDEIRTIVTEGSREGYLEHDAREMIEGVIELDDTDTLEIMTPRSEVDAIDIALPWSEVLEFVIRVGRTRIPVYEENLDQVVGILYVKDLLRELAKEQGEERMPLRELLREPWFVPESKALDDLLQEFLHTRNHMAIVIDEYHAVAGVVTIEDVLEEIVGEIIDESDPEEEKPIAVLEDGAAEVYGRVHLDDINEELGLNIPEPDDYDTIAGFVISQLGRIPAKGDFVYFDDVKITVLQANRRRIELVRIERVETQHREVAG